MIILCLTFQNWDVQNASEHWCVKMTLTNIDGHSKCFRGCLYRDLGICSLSYRIAVADESPGVVTWMCYLWALWSNTKYNHVFNVIFPTVYPLHWKCQRQIKKCIPDWVHTTYNVLMNIEMFHNGDVFHLNCCVTAVVGHMHGPPSPLDGGVLTPPHSNARF